MKKLILAVAAGVVMWTTTASALDITINDTLGTGTGWYRKSPGVAENQEVENNNLTGQVWDMEAFLFDPGTKMLQMQGGYNMWSGMNNKWYSGDIFVDVDGNVLWGANTPAGPTGNGFNAVNNIYGWDYVISFGRNSTASGGGVLNGSYSVWNLNSGTPGLLEAWYDQNNKSNPFRRVTGGSLVTSGSGLQQSSFGDGEGTHYVLGEIPLSWLDGKMGAAPVTFHFTMGCGNDLLMGQTPSWQVPDGGLTLALLGGSLSALVLFSRRMRKE